MKKDTVCEVCWPLLKARLDDLMQLSSKVIQPANATRMCSSVLTGFSMNHLERFVTWGIVPKEGCVTPFSWRKITYNFWSLLDPVWRFLFTVRAQPTQPNQSKQFRLATDTKWVNMGKVLKLPPFNLFYLIFFFNPHWFLCVRGPTCANTCFTYIFGFSKWTWSLVIVVLQHEARHGHAWGSDVRALIYNNAVCAHNSPRQTCILICNVWSSMTKTRTTQVAKHLNSLLRTEWMLNLRLIGFLTAWRLKTWPVV